MLAAKAITDLPVVREIGANDKDTYDLTRRQGYTLAYAFGNASGCTNRGANL